MAAAAALLALGLGACGTTPIPTPTMTGGAVTPPAASTVLPTPTFGLATATTAAPLGTATPPLALETPTLLVPPLTPTASGMMTPTVALTPEMGATGTPGMGMMTPTAALTPGMTETTTPGMAGTTTPGTGVMTPTAALTPAAGATGTPGGATGTPGASGTPLLTNPTDVVREFLTALQAQPDGSTAQPYLSSLMQARVAAGHAVISLLGVKNMYQSFTVTPAEANGAATVTVRATLDYAAGPQGRDFLLNNTAGQWSINAVTPATESGA